MKKMSALLLALLMIASLSSCGSTETAEESTQNETSAVETLAEPTGTPEETETTAPETEAPETAAAETAAPETAAADEEEPTEGAPYTTEEQRIDEEPIDMLELAGLYAGDNGGELNLSMYTSTDTVAVGTFELDDQDGSVLFMGEIQEVMTNYYAMLDADLTMTVYTDNGTICMDVFADGVHLGYYTMTEHYVS